MDNAILGEITFRNKTHLASLPNKIHPGNAIINYQLLIILWRAPAGQAVRYYLLFFKEKNKRIAAAILLAASLKIQHSWFVVQPSKNHNFAKK